MIATLSSCKTTSLKESSNVSTNKETVYNRRESSNISVSSPSVDIVSELKKIGYVKLDVVSNKDTFKVTVTENEIKLDAVISEKEFVAVEVVEQEAVTLKEIESEPYSGSVLTKCIIVIVLGLVVALILKR